MSIRSSTVGTASRAASVVFALAAVVVVAAADVVAGFGSGRAVSLIVVVDDTCSDVVAAEEAASDVDVSAGADDRVVSVEHPPRNAETMQIDTSGLLTPRG